MIEWPEYINQLLENESGFDGVSLSFADNQRTTGIPPIIKASILMLDRMQKHQGKYNIIVFPERIQSIFIFTLMQLLHNISEGRIERVYDPSAFLPGEKLKFGNAIMEFLGIEERNGKRCVIIKSADLNSYSAPIEFLPLFQRTNTQRPLSTYAKFAEARKAAEAHTPTLSVVERQLSILAGYRTHMDSSIFNMTSVINTKQMIASCRLCEKEIAEILLIGQVDYTGTVHNIGAGQLAGIPAIVLASDMYAICEAANKDHPIQSIIVDASDSNAILSQMDALDSLMRLGIPITCVTDIANSFDLQPLESRAFNVWRWDESSISCNLYDISTLASDKKIKHCATRNVEYLKVDGYEISNATKKLSAYRNESKEQSPQMMRVFDDLNSLAFTALRETSKINDGDAEHAHLILNECLRIIETERTFIPAATYDDFKEIISNLDIVYSSGYHLLKQKALAERLLEQDYKDVCIVVPERSDKRHVQDYWQSWCRQNHPGSNIHVLYPAEYYSTGCTQFSVTIVVGWLKRAIMRKILYGFNTQKYIVLLYDYECRWENYDTRRWNKALNSSGNKTIIKQSFSNGAIEISTSHFADASRQELEENPLIDELGEIELILRENKFRQYVARGGIKSASETTEAIPINYVGGYLAFYRTGHKVISATKIITQDEDKIVTLLPNELEVGDFVVVREADHDLIKEIADIILERSGKSGLREMATKWKDALEIEKLFSTPDEIYQKLLDAGCTKGYQAVRSWLFDEDIIAPQQKQDLQYIGAVTVNSVINELLDQIYDAAQEVKAAHVQAGRVLSLQLRSRIVEALDLYGDIDPFNIWEPIEMSVDGIGTVRILKIIDIGSSIMVDIADTNRLIEE